MDVMKPEQSAAPAPQEPSGDQPGAIARDVAHWVHANQDITKKNILGYGTYQFIRGGVAAIPYGASMAGTLGAMVGLERAGKAMGGGFGKRLEQFAKFPAVRSSMMIATSFTLYRGTSKIMKWMHDSLFDPKDTEAQTAQKIHDLPGATVAKIKENAPAGIASTPVAAFALGFVTNTFAKPGAEALKNEAGHSLDWTRENLLAAKAEGRGGKLLKQVLTHPNAKFVEQAAINTLGYSLFFEIGDRLFKDRQIQRGVWKGDKNSIGGKTTEEPQPKKHFGFFTDEPSVGRFVLRRMLPTAVSIGAYTAFKFRHSYMHLGPLAVKEGPIAPQLGKLTGIETKAVLWFAMIPFVNEAWEKVYDKFFARLEKQAATVDAKEPVPAPRHETVEPAVVPQAPAVQVTQATAQARVSAPATQHSLHV